MNANRPSLVAGKDENIANYGYIGTSILRIYRYFNFTDISTDILEKNIDKPKIDQNL